MLLVAYRMNSLALRRLNDLFDVAACFDKATFTDILMVSNIVHWSFPAARHRQISRSIEKPGSSILHARVLVSILGPGTVRLVNKPGSQHWGMCITRDSDDHVNLVSVT